MNKKVAITGYSFRLPGTDTAEIWHDLCSGRDLVTQVDPSRWSKDSFQHPVKGHPGCSYTFAGGSIGDVAGFDAGFFGISPREASFMDPQQRLLLELAWEAMENAGVPPSSLRGSNCGVYIGISTSDYAYRLVDDMAAIDATVATGSAISIAANRISYFFDLHGPSMTIDTACSSSLVAFHQACCSITSGETDYALAGGVNLHLHPNGFLIFAQASMLSPSGCCKVFDASSDGFVRSEGGGLFLLKEYDRAVADGDPILAVVAATAVNTDGRKSGLTVPSADAQALLIEQACRKAGVAPGDIEYFEAHGTGTAVGDPIEALALGKALGQRRPKEKPLPIGSVKSNLGHMEAAAGVAGLIKALLSLQHRMVPATIGITTLNPAIDFDGLNLRVVTENLSLKDRGSICIGVNSFGFGGVNANVILESGPRAHDPVVTREPDVALPLVISARDEAAMPDAARTMAEFLTAHPDLPLCDVAYTALFRRDLHPYRAVVFGNDRLAVAEELQAFAGGRCDNGSVENGVVLSNPSGPAFIYAGNGAQWEGMGKGLLKDPVFLQALEEVDEHFRKYADYSLVDELAGRNGSGRYVFTEFAQPALFAIQVGITRMLHSLGIRPTAVAGHSVGEIAAAWACGALSMPEAVKVIYHRSRLQGVTKGQGGMLAVGLGGMKATELLDHLALPSLALAGHNSPAGVTIAGLADDLRLLEEVLGEQGIRFKRLALDYAFHSPAMDCLETELLQALSDLVPGDATVPFVSTVTGRRLAGTELNAGYWWRNLREPVLFEQTVNAILETGTNVFVCVTPNAILKNYIVDIMGSNGIDGCAIPTIVRGSDEPQRVRNVAAKVLIAGAAIDRLALIPPPGRFVRLPNYPWQRERCWHPVTPESNRMLERRKLHPLLGYRLQHHEPGWENQIDTKLYPMLADHAVGGATVFPGAGFLELILAAAFSLNPDSCVEIEQLEIRAPLLLENGKTRIVRLSVASGDGSVTIKGRELLSESPWTTHSVARIVPASSKGAMTPAPLVLPTRPTDFNTHSHGLSTGKAGLQYGPAFQAIRHGWVDNLTAVAELQTPEVVQAGLEEYHLHPAFLDGGFQLVFQIVQAESFGHQGMTYVPVTIERVCYQPGMGTPRYASATLTGRAPHSLTADFTLYDTEGRTIATVSKVRFRRIRLQMQAVDSLCYPDYHRIPKPLPGTVVLPPADMVELVADAALSAAESAAAEQSLAAFVDELDPLLESLCTRFTIEALQRIAADDCHISEATLQQLVADCPHLPSLIEKTIADGAVSRTESGLRIHPGEPDTMPARQLWQGLVHQYPENFALIHRVGRAGLQLLSLKCGRPFQYTEVHQTVIPSLLLNNALGGGGRFVVGHHLRQLVANLQQRTPEGDRLAVLESSEGAPLWFDRLRCALEMERSSYHFVSGSPLALEHAEQYPDLALHDLSQAQANLAEPVQLAIVTCDFSSQAAAEQTLAAVEAALAPGGCLVLVGMHPLNWAGFLGLGQEVWQPPSAFWQDTLQSSGYESVIPCNLASRRGSGPWLLTARKKPAAPAAVPPCMGRHTLLLAHDDQGPSADLACKLSRQMASNGNRCLRLDVSSEETVLRSLAEAEDPFGILFMTGLNMSNDTLDGDAYLDRQVERCSAASALALMLERLHVPAPVWLLAGGAAADVAEWPAGEQGVSALTDSSFWAFGRTMMNEYSGLDLRLVCLEGGLSEGAVNTLQKEVEQSDGEQEVIITPAGKRFVPRLVPELPPGRTGCAEVDPEQATVRLTFQLPGQLRNLRWQQQPRIAPVEDELEIEVHATGLNFRDIMYTLGLLSDEAVENGFAGAALGLECSGIVTRTGPSATGFAPGDRVIAFGPASFGTRVLTRVSAAAHIPAALGFEAAATIPTAFFTVWYALCHLGRLKPGEKVLIHGAAGGIGLAAIQIARRCGAEIYASAGSDEKREFLRLLGVEHIYDSRSYDFADQILQQTGGTGIDLVLNSLAGEAINRNMRVLKPFGRFLELGKRDFYENTRIGLRPFRNNISYFGVDADQVMKLQPELTGRIFGEIMALFEQGELYPLPFTVFDADQVVDAFRYMQQSRQIGKVVVTYRNGIRNFQALQPPAPPRLQLSPDATWLVTGGLGGFGLRTAGWLVSKGCRSLALISRSGSAGPEAREAIEEMLQQGVLVHTAACDVTDRTAVALFLKSIEQELPPLKGIVHAAAVIEDGLLRTMQPEQLRRVLAPKVLGALHLHHLTGNMPLEYFVLFSSATTLFGNPGQGNYVAANGWLEGLARMRRSAGLPATAVRWGAIDDVGLLARNRRLKESLQGRMGGEALHSDTALAVLEQLLLSNRTGLGVLEFDWPALRRFLPSAAHARFSGLARIHGTEDLVDERADSLLYLSELTDSELRSKVAEILKQEIGRILRLHPDKIAHERSLYEMGLDSLMGVELVTALEARFGIQMPVMALSEGPTLTLLTNRVIGHIRGGDQPDGEHALHEQVAHLSRLHAADISGDVLDDIAAGVATAAPERMID